MNRFVHKSWILDCLSKCVGRLLEVEIIGCLEIDGLELIERLECPSFLEQPMNSAHMKNCFYFADASTH